jgi:tetratricopeptide (TPR) repeat protein
LRLISVAAGLAVLTGCATGAPAMDDTVERCLTLSFAPLDDNVPTCTALIESAEGLAPSTLADVYAARANAYEFALTYQLGHEVSPDALLASALADLDRAVALDPRWHGARGDILFRLSRFEEAAESYTAAIAAEPPGTTASRLESRAFARAEAGDHPGAIADISESMRLSASRLERRRRMLHRGELREAAGDVAGARADFEAVLDEDPESAAARAGLARLGG